MSADNYYVIRKHPKGGYTPIMGFASSDYEREPNESDQQFETVGAAFRHAEDDYSEYGTFVHAECGEDW